MINIDKGIIQFNGNKQDLINDFVCILANFQTIAKLDQKESNKLAQAAPSLILKEDVSELVKSYREEQKEDFMNLFYEEFNIKRLNKESP